MPPDGPSTDLAIRCPCGAIIGWWMVGDEQILWTDTGAHAEVCARVTQTRGEIEALREEAR